MKPIRLAVAGCTGRTGLAVVRLASGDPHFHVVAGLTHPADPLIGRDVGEAARLDPLGVAVQSECAAACDVVVEFTLPAGCAQWAAWCAENGAALVSGTTGLEAPQLEALEQAARSVPVVWAPNMSVGANLLLRLVAEVARRVDESWDVEISETHHRHKVDAPSGTAKALLEAVRRSRSIQAEQQAVFGREGQCGPRTPGEIGVHARRLGEIVGEHDVTFGSAHESLTLQHRAFSRDAFAQGALHVARWACAQPPGLYSMDDVLAQ